MATSKSRRSWLWVSPLKAAHVEEARRARADVIVLDLVELVAQRNKPAAREAVAGTVEGLRSSAIEVFAQIDPQTFDEDLNASVRRGLSGIVVSRAESPQQIMQIAALTHRLEVQNGVEAESIDMIPALETARGNHAAYEIARASPRVRGITLGRADLVMDLRPEPTGEIHLMPYLMQRLIIIAGAVGITPIGAWWRAPDRGLLATPENTYQAARRGRAIGFRGAMCLRANQVDSLNRAYGENSR